MPSSLHNTMFTLAGWDSVPPPVTQDYLVWSGLSAGPEWREERRAGLQAEMTEWGLTGGAEPSID